MDGSPVKFLLRLLLNALAVMTAAYFVPGLTLSGPGAALLAGVVLGFVNAIVRPVLFVLTLPFTLVTLGLFLFILNAICLALTAALVPGFSIGGFWPAVFGALIVSLVSWVVNATIVSERRQH
jgi:putative membrane protein